MCRSLTKRVKLAVLIVVALCFTIAYYSAQTQATGLAAAPKISIDLPRDAAKAQPTASTDARTSAAIQPDKSTTELQAAATVEEGKASGTPSQSLVATAPLAAAKTDLEASAAVQSEPAPSTSTSEAHASIQTTSTTGAPPPASPPTRAPAPTVQVARSSIEVGSAAMLKDSDIWPDPPHDYSRNRTKRERYCRTLNPKTCGAVNARCMWHYGVCVARQGILGAHRCNDGYRYTQCYDVATCAEGVPDPTGDERWAFVFTHNLRVPFSSFSGLTMEHLYDVCRRVGNTDVVMIIPTPNIAPHPIFAEWKEKMRKYNVKLIEVPWWLPPDMKHDTGWCGPQDFIKLHALNLTQYSTVLHIENDVEVTGHGDIMRIIRCATKGYFISATGPLAPMNTGMWAVQPSREIFNAMLHYAKIADYDPLTGWGDAGHAPFQHQYPGSTCGQGFFQAIFTKPESPLVAEAVAHAGAKMPKPIQVDRCTWNHQDGFEWEGHRFDSRTVHRHSCDVKTIDYCRHIIMLHKPRPTPCKKGIMGLTVKNRSSSE